MLSYYMGLGYAFEAELLGMILAIEKAKEFKWRNLWIEYGSIYVVNLFKYKTGKNPMEISNQIASGDQICFWD